MSFGMYVSNPAPRKTHGISGRSSVKRVFANRQVAHVWAQQSQDDGRSSNGNFYFDGKTIYSYRSSWPLATFVDQNDGSKLVLINTDSISNTTSGHLSDVRSALSGLDNVTIIATTREALDNFLSSWKPKAETLARIVQIKFEALQTHAASLANPRKKAYGYGESEYGSDITLATGEARAKGLTDTDLIDAARRLEVPLPAYDLEAMRQTILDAFAAHFDPVANAKRDKARLKRATKAALINAQSAFQRAFVDRHPKWNARRKFDTAMAVLLETRPLDEALPLLAKVQAVALRNEIDAAYVALHPDAAAIVYQRAYGPRSKPMTADEWLSGKAGYFSQHSPTLVRRRGNELETSRGATAPFKAAVAIYLKASDCLRHNKTWHKNGERMKAGAFELDSIDVDGSIRIGCHSIEFSEMERLAVETVPSLVKARYPLPAIIRA